MKRYGPMYAASPKRDVFVFGEMKNGLYVLHSDHLAECERMVRKAAWLMRSESINADGRKPNTRDAVLVEDVVREVMGDGE